MYKQLIVISAWERIGKTEPDSSLSCTVIGQEKCELTEIQEIPFNIRPKPFQGGLKTGTGFPERLCCLCPWRYSKHRDSFEEPGLVGCAKSRGVGVISSVAV